MFDQAQQQNSGLPNVSKREPAIISPLDRVAGQLARLESLNNQLERVKNRLCYGAETLPEAPSTPQPVPEYSNGLVGLLERRADDLTNELNRLGSTIDEIAAII